MFVSCLVALDAILPDKFKILKGLLNACLGDNIRNVCITQDKCHI